MINSFRGKNRFLSNFWPAPVTLDGVEYPSTENAYQAAKTLDLECRKVFETCSSGDAKKLGRQLTVRDDWKNISLGIMLDLNRQKFQDEELKAKLKATGDQELVEGNTWGDTFWGVCNGVGENHLGKILMQVRKEVS